MENQSHIERPFITDKPLPLSSDAVSMVLVLGVLVSSRPVFCPRQQSVCNPKEGVLPRVCNHIGTIATRSTLSSGPGTRPSANERSARVAAPCRMTAFWIPGQSRSFKLIHGGRACVSSSSLLGNTKSLVLQVLSYTPHLKCRICALPSAVKFWTSDCGIE